MNFVGILIDHDQGELRGRVSGMRIRHKNLDVGSSNGGFGLVAVLVGGVRGFRRDGRNGFDEIDVEFHRLPSFFFRAKNSHLRLVDLLSDESGRRTDDSLIVLLLKETGHALVGEEAAALAAL